MAYKYHFDCRTILTNPCPHLHPWNNVKDEGMVKIYSCNKLRNVLSTTFDNEGKVNQKVVQIEPLFECPHLQELRKANEAMPVQACVVPSGITISWNKEQALNYTGPNNK